MVRRRQNLLEREAMNLTMPDLLYICGSCCFILGTIINAAYR
jgi:hypothetical protein